MDNFIVPMMSKNETAVQLSLEKEQKQIVNVMEPFSTVGKTLEDVTKDRMLTSSIEEVSTNMNYTVLLLVQTFQGVI